MVDVLPPTRAGRAAAGELALEDGRLPGFRFRLHNKHDMVHDADTDVHCALGRHLSGCVSLHR